MITLNTPKFDQAYIHNVTVTRSIGTFAVGKKYDCRMMKCTGKLYKPGKDDQGKFIDTVGEPDTRYMIFSSDAYAIATKDELDMHFNEVNG